MIVLALFSWCALASLMTAAAFAIDKKAARDGDRRVSEATLLKLALFGGTPGAYWARARFRHKTRKQPFVIRLHLIAVVQIGMMIGLTVPLGR